MASQPDPPDPYATAAAQGAADRSAAITSGFFNNPDENTPFGSSRTDITGYYTDVDAEGNKYKVPLTTRTTTLAPAEQAKLDLQNELGIGLLETGNRQMGQISDALSDPFTLDGIAKAPKSVRTAQLDANLGKVGPDRKYRVPVPTFDTKVGGATYGNAPTPGTLGTDLTAQQFQTEIGLDRASGTYGSGGRVGDLAIDGYTPGGMFREGNPNIDTGFQRSYAPEDGFSADRDRVVEAMYSRLDPAFDRDYNAMENRLVNQGFTRGTEAFNSQMDELRRQQTDARYQAELYGGQEQSRLLGEARAAGQFGNDAIARANDATLAGMGYNLAAQGQREGQALQRAQFGASTVGQNNAAALAAGQFRQQGQQLQSAQDLAQMQARNDAIAQQFGLDLSAQGFDNSVQAQGFQDRLAQNQVENDAKQRIYNANLQSAQFHNQTRDADFAEALTRQQQSNQVQQQRFGNRTAAAQYEQDARARAIQEALLQRTQPLNEMSAAVSGSPVNVPQFQSMYRQGINPEPVADSVWKAYEAEANQANAFNSGLFGLLSAPFSLFG